MNKIEKKYATIGLREYIKEYRNIDHFLTFCKECNGFSKTWACPPFEENEDFAQYNYATIFGLKIAIAPEEQTKELAPDEFRKATLEIIGSARESFDRYMLQLEKETPNSRALFGGSCRVCPTGECTRPKGEPCVKPSEMRPSLEAVGFDIGKTTSQLLGIELKWGDKTLPEYFTLVYGLFSKEPLKQSTFQ